MAHYRKLQLTVFLPIAVLVGSYFIFFGKDKLHTFQNDSTSAPKTLNLSTTQYDFIASIPPQFVATGCDSSLWQYNAEEEKVSAPCIYLTGVVQQVRPEDDGDMNIQLKPDSQYSGLLNSYNSNDGGGNIGLEPICVVRPSKTVFKKACKGYSNHVTIPEVGMHIGVKGSYGQDKHYWMEIHPVTSIDVL